jgi:glycosyltransferase involved in cell wall biosynthesis
MSRQRAQGRGVVVWLPALWESTGGIQSFSRALLQALLGNEQLGHIDILVKNDRITSEKLVGNSKVRVWTFGRWREGPVRTCMFVLGLISVAALRRPNLIIVGHANFVRVASLVRRALGIPFWVILHGVEVWNARGKRVGKYLHKAERLLAVSRFTRDKVAKEQGLDLTRFSLLPNTVDGDRFRPAPKASALLEKLGIPADARIILTVCRLIRDESYKGYDQILAALPKVKASVPDVHFLLVGRGDDAVRVQREVNENGLDQCVTFPGYVPEQELVDYYNLCDVYVMPSRGEGFGIVFLEALACGKPVLAGNCDGASDALRDGELGILVDPADIAELASTLIALLSGTHPHPLVFRPDELRRRTLDYFGREQFARSLNQYLEDSLERI